MKLSMELVRKIMLDIEKNIEFLGDDISFEERKESRYKKYSQDQVIYTLLRLEEANYINARHYDCDDEINLYVTSLTWEGHAFLDNIRDNKVWKKTKCIAKSFSSISLNMISNIAAQVITNIINEKIML